jgi:hypothetical protein
MAVAIVGENKRLFGYDDVARDPPYAFDRVSVPSSMSLVAMAKAAGRCRRGQCAPIPSSGAPHAARAVAGAPAARDGRASPPPTSSTGIG